MKTLTNILLIACFVMFIAISESKDLTAVVYTLTFTLFIMWCRINHKKVTAFFHEKEEL